MPTFPKKKKKKRTIVVIHSRQDVFKTSQKGDPMIPSNKK